ncbi:MAG: hypothetical protein Q7K29_02325 [Thermoleophilia bacterium]|nr:hypothetical protein [Thermoleophilia bacterium]
MRLSNTTLFACRLGAISTIAVIILIAGISCNSGDDIVTTPTTPAAAKPAYTTRTVKPVTPTVADDDPVSRPGPEEIAPTIMSDLRNAAVAEEGYFTDRGFYTVEVTDLFQFGYEPSANIDMFVSEADNLSYCLEAFNVTNPSLVMSFQSYDGEPLAGSCP